MPMTEKLQKALNNPNIVASDVADLLKRDGFNCRDSVTFDTPLIVAARNNNLNLIEYIINNVRNAGEKINVINSVNKREETALTTALINNNPAIALRLLQFGASAEISISSSTIGWLQAFLDYAKIKDLPQLSPEMLAKRAKAATEIGTRYYQELGDVAEATKWFELAANDGSRQGMVNLATIYQANEEKLAQAVFWLKKSYPLWTEQNTKDVVINQLRNIASSEIQNIDAVYAANMALGYVSSLNGEIDIALNYYKNAEGLHTKITNVSEKDELLFTACSLWNGSSYDKQISANDYLNLSKRFEWLIHANSDEAQALISAFANDNTDLIIQIVAAYYGNEHHLLDESQNEILTQESNKIYLQALSTLYGWNGQVKNALRAAGLLRKISETNKQKNPDLAATCQMLIAFAYYQQEREQEAYYMEAFDSLDRAHEYLTTIGSNKRRELVLTLVDAISYVNEEILHKYVEVFMHCYKREASLLNASNMKLLVDRLISIADHLQTYLELFAEVAIECYRNIKDNTLRASIVEFLNLLKEHVPIEAEQKVALDKAIVECSQSSIDEKDYSIESLDAAVDSFKTIVANEEDETNAGFQEKYTDVLMLRAQTKLSQGKYDEALKDFVEVYEATNERTALCCIAHIETELGLYDEAIKHYNELSELGEMKPDQVEMTDALMDLKRISEELISRDSRRAAIEDIIKKYLYSFLSGDTSHITTFKQLTEIEYFTEMVQDDLEIIQKITELRDRITPLELERMEKEKQQEEKLRFQKMLEGQGRSPEHRLVTLLSLSESEQHNPDRIKQIRNAINHVIDSMVRMDKGIVYLKNDNALLKLMKQGYLLASYYIAKYHEQNTNIIGALSLYARIIMSPVFDENDKKIKAQCLRLIESYKNADEGSGITKIFSKQPKIGEYILDLLEVIKEPSSFEDPDVAMQAGLHEKSSNIDSYNNYNLSISMILGK